MLKVTFAVAVAAGVLVGCGPRGNPLSHSEADPVRDAELAAMRDSADSRRQQEAEAYYRRRSEESQAKARQKAWEAGREQRERKAAWEEADRKQSESLPRPHAAWDTVMAAMPNAPYPQAPHPNRADELSSACKGYTAAFTLFAEKEEYVVQAGDTTKVWFATCRWGHIAEDVSYRIPSLPQNHPQYKDMPARWVNVPKGDRTSTTSYAIGSNMMDKLGYRYFLLVPNPDGTREGDYELRASFRIVGKVWSSAKIKIRIIQK